MLLSFFSLGKNQTVLCRRVSVERRSTVHQIDSDDWNGKESYI